METIEINGKSYLIDIEKATEQGLLKEKDSKPRSWEEYDKTLKLLHVTSEYDKVGVGGTRFDNFETENEAKAFCALGKLIQLRDAWIGDWKPDWNDSNKHKWCIINDIDNLVIGLYGNTSRSLSFPTKKMANDFLETFRNLIEQAKIFL